MKDNNLNRALMRGFRLRYTMTMRQAALALGYTYSAWRAYERGQNTVKAHVVIGMQQYNTIKALESQAIELIE